MKKTMKLSRAFALFGSALLLAGVFDPASALAQAGGTNFADTTIFWARHLNPIPSLISAVCYIAGIVFIAVGVLKLKEHADDARSHKISPAVVRLFVGAMLVSLPIFASWVATTTSIGGTPLTFDLGGHFGRVEATAGE